MKFQPGTIEALRDKLANLKGRQTEVKEELDHYNARAAEWRSQHDVLDRTIADYAALLRYAECDEEREPIRPFKIDDRVIVNDAGSLNHGTYGFISGTNPSGELLVEFDRDGTTHNYEASQLVHEDGAP